MSVWFYFSWDPSTFPATPTLPHTLCSRKQQTMDSNAPPPRFRLAMDQLIKEQEHLAANARRNPIASVLVSIEQFSSNVTDGVECIADLTHHAKQPALLPEVWPDDGYPGPGNSWVVKASTAPEIDSPTSGSDRSVLVASESNSSSSSSGSDSVPPSPKRKSGGGDAMFYIQDPRSIAQEESIWVQLQVEFDLCEVALRGTIPGLASLPLFVNLMVGWTTSNGARLNTASHTLHVHWVHPIQAEGTWRQSRVSGTNEYRIRDTCCIRVPNDRALRLTVGVQPYVTPDTTVSQWTQLDLRMRIQALTLNAMVYHRPTQSSSGNRELSSSV